MIGGVIAHHPYLRSLLEEKLLQQIQVLDNPQHVVSFGAALIAKQHYNINQEKNQKAEISSN